MSAAVREKFSALATPEVLAVLRQVAEAEGRPLQAVIDDALRDPRQVTIAFAASLAEFDSLYRELAK